MADLSTPLIAFDQMSFAEDDPSFWESMGSMYGYSWRPILGSLGNMSFKEDENFNVFDYLTDEDLDSRRDLPWYATARSEEHLNYLRSHLGKMEQNREIMSRSGWGPLILASVLDPINLISLPFRGVTIGAKAWSGAKSGFLLGAGTEAIRAPFDPNATLAEVGLNITGSTVMLGTIGGVVGAFSGKATKNFTAEQTAVNKSLNQKVDPNRAFDYKDNWFVNSPFFKALSTPFKRVLQGNLPQSTKKLITLIGADGGLTSMMNKAGQGISSVFMRSVTYMGDYMVHKGSLQNIYDKFLRQEGIKIKWGQFNASFKDFAERLSKERIARENPNYIPQKLSNLEEEFIGEMDLFYTNYGVQMIENGQLLTKDSLIKKIKTLEDEVKSLGDQFKTEKVGRAKTQLRKMLGRKVEQLKDAKTLEKLDFDPKYKGIYFPRYFKIDAVSTRIDEFKNILRKWYTENPFITKSMIKGEQLKQVIENTQIKLLEKKQLLEDIILKKYGKKEINDPKNKGRFKQGGPYSDKQYSAMAKLRKDIDSLETKLVKDELELTKIETDMPLRIEEAVNATVNKILNKTNHEADFMGVGLSKHLRHRELDIPNHLIMDFIETNPMDVAMYYMMRTGSKIEFANTFKGKSMDDLMEEEHLQMIRYGNDDATIASAKADIYHMYDRVVGTAVHNPDALNRRMARAITDWTAYVFLGRAGLSSLPELGMILMQHASKQGPLGWQNLGTTFRALSDFKSLGLSAKEVQIVGEALDMTLGIAHNRMYEDFLRSPFNKGISKVNETGKKWFYMLNGLAPITQATKKMAGVLGQHTLVDRSLRWVNGTLDQEGIELLSRYGLTLRDAKKIKALVDDGTIQTSDSGLLYLANTTAWTDQKLMRKFRGSLNTMTRNTIINATPADKPTIVDGVVYMKMNPVLKRLGYKPDKRVSVGDVELVRIEYGPMAFPFQFWNYTMGATQKIMASGFDMERSGKVAGFTTMLALGYLTLWAKNPTSFGYMDWEDQLARSIDQTGITGIYSDLFYTSLHARHRMEDLDSKDTLIQPKYNVKASPISSIAETATDFSGASPSYFFDIADTVNHFVHGETNEGLSQACRLMPFSSLYGMRSLCGTVEGFGTRGRF